ncbi:MAG: hypothetical protein ACKVP4_14255 [Hyphomicrobium sp.]
MQREARADHALSKKKHAKMRDKPLRMASLCTTQKKCWPLKKPMEEGHLSAQHQVQAHQAYGVEVIEATG